MITPTHFTISDQKTGNPIQTGDVYSTKFGFKSSLPLAYKRIIWHLGDGNKKYNQRSFEHSYNYPGVYTVTLEAWTRKGTHITDEATVTVDYVYRDSIVFSSLPIDIGMPGLPSKEPFVLDVVSTRINEPISILLHAANSRSVPLEAVAEEKWRFLIPTWKFTDLSGNTVVDSLSVNTVPLYKDNVQVGVSGQASFYYIDESSTITSEVGCPILLIATLDTKKFSYPVESLNYPYYSYSNNETVRAAAFWEIHNTFPTNLKVTENYLNEIHPTKWSGIPLPVMVTCKFDPGRLTEFAEVITSSAVDVFSYPLTNEYGKRNELVLSLSSSIPISRDHYTVNETPLYFQNKDEKNNNVAGYVFTTITPLCSFETDVVVSASAVVTNFLQNDEIFPLPLGVPLLSPAFVANPNQNCINRIKLNFSNNASDCEELASYGDSVTEGYITTTRTSPLCSISFNYELSGSSAVYGLAFNPFKDILYAADADQDKIYSYKKGIESLTSIDISKILTPLLSSTNTPSYISIDGKNDIWVSLYDNQTLLKFNSSLTFLASARPNVTISPLSSQDNSGVNFGATTPNGNFLIAPPVVETDRENNIWACYAHPLSSLVVKFSADGTQMGTNAITIPTTAVPVSLSINKQNNVWVACYASNELRLLSGTNGSLMKRLTGIERPSYTAMSRDNGLWVTHGFNLCSYINTTNWSMSTWSFFDSNIANSIPINKNSGIGITKTENGQVLQGASYIDNEIWSGLATDVFDRVWLVDGFHNATILFDPNNPKKSKIIKNVPTTEKNFIIETGSEHTTEIAAGENVRSSQAAGDWTGNKWYQKYVTGYDTLSVYGNSTPFRVYDINTDFNIAKTNEEFDMPAYLKSLAIPEIFSQNTELFDIFFKGILGDGDITKENIGRIIYERIANFFSAHADVDTAEVRQLLSIARMFSVKTKTFGETLPREIEKIINLFSIPRNNLAGYKKIDPSIENTVGKLVTLDTQVSAGQFLYFKDVRYGTYNLLQLQSLSSDGTSVYPLSSADFPYYGIRVPIEKDYYFFEYDERAVSYTGNVINWDSDFTSLSYNLSSEEDLYADGGYVDKLLNNILTKRLFSEE